ASSTSLSGLRRLNILEKATSFMGSHREGYPEHAVRVLESTSDSARDLSKGNSVRRQRVIVQFALGNQPQCESQVGFGRPAHECRGVIVAKFPLWVVIPGTGTAR